MPDTAHPSQTSETESAPPSKPGSGVDDHPSVTEKQATQFLISNLPSVGREMGDLIGKPITFEDVRGRWMERAEILQMMPGPSLLCGVDVLEDAGTAEEGHECAFMLWPFNDAALFSGVLLMASPSSIAETIRNQTMDSDWLDAFGEIVNIFVGGYSNRMRNHYPVPRALRKQAVAVFDPHQSDGAEGSSGIPDGWYFCLSAQLDVERQVHGPMLFLFPPRALGLEAYDPEQADRDAGPESVEPPPDAYADLDLEALVVVLGDAPETVAQVVRALRIPGVDVLQAGQGYDLIEYLSSSRVNCVFLVVASISPPILARAGKIRSLLSHSCAMVLAGHDWTREYVLQARTEGIDDILVLPAEDEAIRDKCLKFISDSELQAAS